MIIFFLLNCKLHDYKLRDLQIHYISVIHILTKTLVSECPSDCMRFTILLPSHVCNTKNKKSHHLVSFYVPDRSIGL